MRLGKRKGFLAGAWVAAAAIWLLGIGNWHGSMAADDANAARIARIENGLLPAVAIKGQPVPAYKLSERMAHFKVPGLSVAFFENGKIAWTRAYGYADLALKSSVTPATLFQAASISKPVAALAALRLVEEGKLALDESVNLKLRSWKVPDTELTREEKVTLRRLLTHSAGMTVHGFPGYALGEEVPTVVQILNGEKPANTAAVRVDAVPGKTWRYSGGGFTVMQLLVVDVTGRAFPVLMNDLVLKPAGMTSSTYEQPLPRALAAKAATPYRASGEPVKGGPHIYPEMAAAGLWTTPADLARAAIEVEKEYDGASSAILSQAMARQYISRQKGDWGLGISVLGEGRSLHFTHGGANEGYRCLLADFPLLHQGAAIMTNSDAGDSVADELLRAIAKEYGWPGYGIVEHSVAKVNSAVLASYGGTYESEETGKVVVAYRDGRLYVQAPPLGPAPLELLPESPTDFFLLTETLTARFIVEGRGPAETLILRGRSQTYTLRRTK